MSFNASPQYAGSYLGVRAPHPPDIIMKNFIPGPGNWQNVVVGDIWIYQPSPTSSAGIRIYMLVSLYGNQALWVEFTSSSGTLISLTGNDGIPVLPSPAGNINLITGNTTVKVLGNVVTFTEGIDFGLSNLLLGSNGAITSGLSNVGLGLQAAGATTSGSSNTAIGYQALLANTTGSFNTALGTSTLSGSITGSSNTAVGYGALFNSNGASGNIAIGTQSLSGNVVAPATNNIAIGNTSLLDMTTGQENTAVGFNTLSALTTGSLNLALGANAGSAYSSTENSNIVLGNTGTLFDTNTIRIGTQGAGSGQQNACFIAGIVGVTVSNPQTVVINSATGQLGIGAGGGTPLESLTGDSGGAVTPTAGTIIVSGGTTGLTFAGTNSPGKETLTGTLGIANGGTNATSFAVTDGTVYYNGTQLVTVSSVGTAGQVLTSNGAGVAPSYQSIPSGGTVNHIFGAPIVLNTVNDVYSDNVFSNSPTSSGFSANNTPVAAPVSGTMSGLAIDVSVNGSTTDTALTLVVNGVPSTLTVAITALTTGVFQDTTHSVAIARGDSIVIHGTTATTNVINGVVSYNFLA